MKMPEWLRPGIYGAVAGAVATMVIGFSWGGWVTGGTAREQAADSSEKAVVAALASICVDRSTRDPMLAERVAALKEAASYGRADIVMKTGWAKIPGIDELKREVASACGNQVASS
jgi:hypothetical protein